MKVVTKYEVLETRELNEIEIEGIESILNKTYPEWDGLINCFYSQTCLHPEDRLVVSEGEISRIGMVSNRVVFEIELLDQETGIPTEEAVLYWADVMFEEFKLEEIGG